MTIAFIPVRGGSKSIPDKNIKSFCGKPLVCWAIESLENSEDVDEVIVATDSNKIKEIINAYNYKKVKIYNRSPENASDTASTESVMLEYIAHAKMHESTTFMVVQATSPLTQTQHFAEALQMYKKKNFDSILSCVKNTRFFWNPNGTSINYDYQNRPRRQDFEGMWMENGAFYISSVKNILTSRNRLSGRIGIYEMPEYTSTEIDEPDDWIILENLMRKHVISCKADYFKNIKLFLSDVDGTMTDAGMYYSETGDELKKFNTKDGLGFRLLNKAGIKTGIITSEITKIVENRAKKLHVNFLYQGKLNGDKLNIVKNICQKEQITLQEVAYIGDDVNCIDLLSAVGFAACPADANLKVKEIPEIHIMQSKGGEGCVREWIDMILG